MTVDRIAIDQTAKTDAFLPSHGSDGHGTWCGGSQGPSVYKARESLATEPTKVNGRLDDRGCHSICKLFTSYERTVVQILASKLSKVTERAVYSWLKLKR